MKIPKSIYRYLFVSALTTIFLANSMAFSAFAVRPFKKEARVVSRMTASSSRPSSSKSLQRSKATAAEAYGKLPLNFEANNGQTDSRVKFLARGAGYSLFLTATEAVLNLHRSGQRDSGVKDESSRGSSLTPPSSFTNSTLRMKLVGAEPNAQIAGGDELPGRTNYFTGRNSENWHTDVSTYARVRYQRIYPGIDMTYYGNQGELEYDFVIAPGADARNIKLSFAGARNTRIAANGDLILRTTVGEIRQHKPVAYQETGGSRQSLAARYVVRDGKIGFQVAPYDTTRPLIIDPVLSYSTYLGGAGNYEVAFGVAVDADGNAYVTGTTASADYPVTAGAFQSTIGGNNSAGDAFVTKLNPTGMALVYSTYLGGSARDFAWAIAVDAGGNAYITGDTESYDFPTTLGAFQPAHAAGTEVDGFVVKLNPAGSALVYSTYLGGSGNEDVRAITVNSLGEAYVTGETPSPDFPVTPGAYRTVIGSDSSNHDAFLTKLNATGASLGYSTFLGGGSATGNGIALDSAGNAYIVGVTYFLAGLFSYPVTPNAYQPNAAAEGFEGFISELNSTGTDLLYSTYLGGNMEESAVKVAVDASDKVYVTGYTGSSDFPITPGCAQPVRGSSYDAFIAKFDTASSGAASLVYSTFLGGSDLEDPHGLAVDSAGNAYVAGYTQSSDFPVTQSLGATGFLNAFVTKLNAAGSQFDYSTRFGDTYTYGYGLAIDSSGNAYVVGQTTSSGFLTTPGAYQTTLAGGGSDAFAVKIEPGSPANTPVGTNVIYQSGNVTVTFDQVTVAGNTTITPIPPASAGTLPGQYVLTGDSLAFEITTTASYTGSITVCIVDSSVADQATFDSLRILHGEAGMLVDRTILPPDTPAPDFTTRMICARVSSLSPFVIAKLTSSYGIQVLFDQTKPVKSGSTLPIKLQLTDSSGANVSSASIVVTALSVLRISTNVSGTVQDSGSANPDNNFHFAGGSYIFNLSTRGYATGTYRLRFRAGSDPVVHTVDFQVK